MTSALYEVAPVAAGWLVRMPGDSISELHKDKASALRRARELGRRHDSWRIHVLEADGTVETELSSPEAKPVAS